MAIQTLSKNELITSEATTNEFIETNLHKFETALLGLWNQLESDESRRGYRADWRRWCHWLTSKSISPLVVTTADVQRYLSDMHDRKLTKATRARALAVIRRVYGVLVRSDVLSINPAREAENIRVSHEPRTPWLSAEEISTLLKRPEMFSSWREQRDWLILATLIGTGLRRSEVANLTYDRLFTPETGVWATKVRAKGGKEGIVALPKWLAHEIHAWEATNKCRSGPIFPTNHKSDRPVSGGTIRNIVKRAADKTHTAIKRATPHALRRSFVTITGQLGVSLEDRQAALLHSNRATTELYDKAVRAMQSAPGNVLEDIVMGQKNKTSPNGGKPGGV